MYARLVSIICFHNILFLFSSLFLSELPSAFAWHGTASNGWAIVGTQSIPSPSPFFVYPVSLHPLLASIRSPVDCSLPRHPLWPQQPCPSPSSSPHPSFVLFHYSLAFIFELAAHGHGGLLLLLLSPCAISTSLRISANVVLTGSSPPLPLLPSLSSVSLSEQPTPSPRGRRVSCPSHADAIRPSTSRHVERLFAFSFAERFRCPPMDRANSGRGTW